jgi:hypothetical protein
VGFGLNQLGVQSGKFPLELAGEFVQGSIQEEHGGDRTASVGRAGGVGENLQFPVLLAVTELLHQSDF